MNGKKKLPYILAAVLLAGIVIVTVAAGVLEIGKTDNKTEQHLEQGQQYLSAMEYEAAVAEYMQVINIDPYHEEANRGLLNAASAAQDYVNAAAAAERMAAAFVDLSEEELLLAQEAFEGAGRSEELTGFYSMLYHTNATEMIIEKLLTAQAESYNYTAMENTLTDMEQKGIETAKYIDNVLNMYIQENNEEAVGKLLEICQNNRLSEEVVEGYVLYEMILEEKDFDEILAYLNENEMILDILNCMDDKETLYIGGYNEKGEMSGKGICIYADGRFSDTNLYIGDFVDGVRCGNGIAYQDKYYYIVCEWQNDLPNGHAEKYMYGDYSTGSLQDGHISKPTTMYDGVTGDIIYVCGIPDSSFESGYGYADGGDFSELYDDPCPGAHTYCWDCAMREEE